MKFLSLGRPANRKYASMLYNQLQILPPTRQAYVFMFKIMDQTHSF